MANENEKKFRVESDLLGELQVPAEAYYGVQTQRAINNYKISGKHMCDYPEYVKAIAYVKLAAAEANHELGQLPDDVADAMCRACREIIDGKYHENFVTDMVQGGAGTSVNMNANEVIANRALELMGYEKGDYQHCWPNDHCNCGQSTNDVYPTTIRLTFIEMNKQVVAALERLVASFRKKGEEFKNNIKMGRTQLQDAVPMTSGQEFTAFANTLEEEIGNLNRNVELMLEINMGATAIGTGLNAVPGYAELCTKKLAELTGENFTLGKDLVEATPDTGDYVSYSGALKRLAVKLSKICNDLRLMASGPRCGLHEINLPPMAPGSSIMPGKVNPTQCEALTMVAVQVMGNDVAVSMAASQGNFELNVFMPVCIYNFLQSARLLAESIVSFNDRCAVGIRANREKMEHNLHNSLMLVTALNPYIGYENAAKTAKKAYKENISLKEACVSLGFLTAERFDEVFHPENMI